MVLGLSTSSDNALYWYKSTSLLLYSSRSTANTGECTDRVVRKCVLRH